MVCLLDYKAISLMFSMTIHNYNQNLIFTCVHDNNYEKTGALHFFELFNCNDLNFSTRIIPLTHFRYVVGRG